jgi:hypothetical protein
MIFIYFFSFKNVALRVKNTSEWSENFLIDAAGNIGTITCKSKVKHYEVNRKKI